MKSSHHGNWLFAIFRINIPLLLLGIFLVLLTVTVLSFCFSPIYEGSTVLTLDSDAERVLRDFQLSYPSLQAKDYIRYEYFAIHSVTLMRSPDIARKVISKYGIKDGSGALIPPEDLVNPGLFKLIFENNGEGIGATWIADTQQFSISGYSKDPEKAVSFSRGYAEAFLRKNADQFKGIITVLVGRLKDQIGESATRIKGMEKKIKEIKREHNTFDPAVESEDLTSQIFDLEGRLASSVFSEKTYRKKIVHFSKKAKDFEKLETYRHIMRENPVIKDLKTKIIDLTGQMVSASVEYTPSHPAYVRLEKRLKSAEEALKKEARRSFYQETKEMSPLRDEIVSDMLNLTLAHLVFKSEVEHLESRIVKYRNRLNELTEAQSAVDSLDRELNTFSQLKSTAQKNLIRIQNITDNSLSFYRVVSYAWINEDNLKHYKFFPRRRFILVVSCAIALILFSFLIIAWEMQKDPLYYSWQLSDLDSHSDVAEVPTIKKTKGPPGGFEALVCSHMRTVHLPSLDSGVVRVVSELKGEGKATIGSALAWYFAKAGKSVLLVDGDSINRSCTMELGMGDRPGLMEYLSGQNDLSDIRVNHPAYKMDIIPSGSVSATGRDPSMEKALLEMLLKLSERYDRIIFLDTPLSNTLFASIVGIDHDIVLVMKSGEHSVSEAKEILSLNESSLDRGTIRAVVLNQLPFSADLFSWKGLCGLILHLARHPFSVLRR